MTARRRRGRLVNAQGLGVAGALVSVAWSDGPAPEVAAKTDLDGAFTLALPEGAFELVAHLKGEEIARARVHLAETGPEDLVLKLAS